MGSGPPQDELLKALQSFNVFGCYIDTLGPQRMQEECWNTVKRVASPRVSVLGKIAKKLQVFYHTYLYNGTQYLLFRRFKKINIDKKGPDPADIEVASKFLIQLGAGIGFTESFYGMVLDNIVDWIEVTCWMPSFQRFDTKHVSETEAS